MSSRRQQELESQGWTRQNIADEPRLSELVETYREIGFEVCLEPFVPEEEEGCHICMDQEPERYRIIYTRTCRKDNRNDNGETL